MVPPDHIPVAFGNSLQGRAQRFLSLGLHGVRVEYCGEAHSDADMAASEKNARTQRQRWEQGRIALIRQSTAPLLLAAFKRRSLICLDLALDLDHIVRAQPKLPDGLPAQIEPVRRWMEALEVQNRKVQEVLGNHGIHPYDAVIGMPYNPALHERVSSRRVDGMDALRVAEQLQHGFASQQPEFVLRRPKVIVSE